MRTICPDTVTQKHLFWTLSVLFVRQGCFLACPCEREAGGVLCFRTTISVRLFFFFLMGSLEEDLLSNEGVRHFWLSGWGGARKISLLPLSDRRSTAFSLFFHCLQQEPFHNDLPTVISLLKAVALGSGQEVGCVSSSLWLLVLCVSICLPWGQSSP